VSGCQEADGMDWVTDARIRNLTLEKET